MTARSPVSRGSSTEEPTGVAAADEPAAAASTRMVLAHALGVTAAGLGSTTRGLAGFIASLAADALRFDAADPDWPDRDRVVVSDGTLSPLLYGMLHLAGFDGMERDVLDRFGRLGSAAAPWPLPSLHPAIEAAAGLPGQGFAAAVGIALGERLMAARFGRSLVDHRTWVLASATDLAAGLGQEVASIAGALRLDRLAVVFEEPEGPPGEAARDKEEIELLRRFGACGWSVRSVDGEDPRAVASCLAAVDRARRPTLIACRPSTPVSADGVGASDAALLAWRRVGARGAAGRRAWLRRLARHKARDGFELATAGLLPPAAHAALRGVAGALLPDESPLDAAMRGLDAIAAAARAVVFLSSARTEALLSHHKPIDPGAFDGRHVPCGAQEHGMATLANGLSLHRGLLPVSAVPAIAADRIRPALRVAALTGRKLVVLLTEDGLSAASEGAALQPVEQLAGLRATPGLHVFRPSCRVEAIECLELALRRVDGPSVIVLSAEKLPTRRDAPSGGTNRAQRGAHVLAEPAGGDREVTLVASGAEVALALDARARLERDGIRAAVVSLSCWELFDRQDPEWRRAVLGRAPRLGLEAASGFGWERWLGEDGCFVGLDGFGASGEAAELRAHLGLTAASVAARARALLRATVPGR